MKNISALLIKLAIVAIILVNASAVVAQAIDPARSAKAAVLSDANFITTSIRDNEDAVYLSQKAVERGTDTRVKELAQQMVENHTAMLYAMQQLDNAGTGASTQGKTAQQKASPAAIDLNYTLDRTPGQDFDSTWTAGILVMQEAKYVELTQSKETVTNTQLKMAITDAIPSVRKHVAELKSIQKYLIKLATQERKEAAARAKEQKKKK